MECIVISNRIKAFYFNENINSKCYVNLIPGPFFQELRDKEKTSGYFMQDMQQLTQINS